jgi:hypothetical protein
MILLNFICIGVVIFTSIFSPAFAGRDEVALFSDEVSESCVDEYSFIQKAMMVGDIARAAKNIRLVNINPTVLEAASFSSGDKIFANLFEDAAYTLVIGSVTLDINNICNISGGLEKNAGFFSLSISDGLLQGGIHDLKNNQEYTVAYFSEFNSHILVHVDQENKDVLPESGPLTVPD